ncbi:hypothetical protein PoB_001639500 [Plakobranchus ocellatus]|uniref:Uncharacterized protein n=1 Tax=Plakobranchus ocellatus TaxID=259542 RepID=A0AAV3Z5R8_9GAST|nr:hypothetical protein PoB_001639500 [Plakobranchus ocellatus]
MKNSRRAWRRKGQQGSKLMTIVSDICRAGNVESPVTRPAQPGLLLTQLDTKDAPILPALEALGFLAVRPAGCEVRPGQREEISSQPPFDLYQMA